MPRRYKLDNLYWWKAYTDTKVLVKLIDEAERYLTVRIMTISEAAVIRTRHGAGEFIRFDPSSAPLEEVAP